MNKLDPMGKLLEAAKFLLESSMPLADDCDESNISMVIKALEIAMHHHSNSFETSDLMEITTRLGQLNIELKKQIETHDIQKMLADKIRAGNFDNELFGDIYEILRKDVASRLERSNPAFISNKKFSQFFAN